MFIIKNVHEVQNPQKVKKKLNELEFPAMLNNQRRLVLVLQNVYRCSKPAFWVRGGSKNDK